MSNTSIINPNTNHQREMSLLNYEQQANEPEWFNKNEDHFYHSVTRGSSQWNEWFEFKSYKDALDFSTSFTSEAITDQYVCATVQDGVDRWVHDEDWHAAWGDSGPELATFAELAEAESRF